jgi:hypothetical protein
MGTVDGIKFYVRKTGDPFDHNFYTIQFAKNFRKTLMFIGYMQTGNGMDTASVRWQNRDVYAVEVQIDEEQSKIMK